eukprot:scaffold17265_cov101-Isochrysis_galbana.AAC.3
MSGVFGSLLIAAAFGWTTLAPSPHARQPVAAAVSALAVPLTADARVAARVAAPLRPARVAGAARMDLHLDDAKQPIGVGIVGCGRIGIVHLDTLRKCPKAKVTSIGGSSSEETVRALAQKYNVAHYSKDADEVIRHPSVQAVWICSPSQYHAQQIRLAAELGKDIFCEKPVATELDETIEAGGIGG